MDSFTSIAERSDAARREFTTVAQKYNHSSPGELARYFVGVTFKDEGKFADAEKQFKSVVESGDRDVATQARYALASVYVATNRYSDAIQQYKQIVDHPAATMTKAEAQLDLLCAPVGGVGDADRGQPVRSQHASLQVHQRLGDPIALAGTYRRVAPMTLC